MQCISEIEKSITLILKHDPQLLFVDSFDTLRNHFSEIENIISSYSQSQRDYYIVYNAIIMILPYLDKLIYIGYSDQILEFLLTINSHIPKFFIFLTSRYIPFRLQIFTTICSAYANCEEPHETDALEFIKSFRDEIDLQKQLEESNINGLSITITTCNNQTTKLSDLFDLAYLIINLTRVHFDSSFKIDYEDPNLVKPQHHNKKSKKEKEPEEPKPIPIPSINTIQLIINAFNSPLPPNQYNSKFSSVVSAWTNPECSIGLVLLYRLLFSFSKSGKISNEILTNLKTALPDDQIIQLLISINEENWPEVSNFLVKISVDDLAVDIQFFNEIALKMWNLYSEHKIQEDSILKGILRVLIASPSSYPLQLGLAALHYSWYLNSVEQYQEACETCEKVLNLIESFRDNFSMRKYKCVLASHRTVPNKPHNQDYLSFENWLQCIHTDLLSCFITMKLKRGLEIDIELAKQKYDEDMENTMNEVIKTKKLYGMVMQKQQQTMDQMMNRPFKPPIHSESTEQELLTLFKSNKAAKALLYLQMAFFRPNKASTFLEKARFLLTELETSMKQPNLASNIIYINRYEIGIHFSGNSQRAKSIAVFGKELIGTSGLTAQNTALQGTGIKQDEVEPFIITRLKPNTEYCFGFGFFNKSDDLIDNIDTSLIITTCHPLTLELIWSYIASASYQLNDMVSFDSSLTFLLHKFVTVSEMPHDNQYYMQMNPFNRFLLKEETFEQPAPMLRSFANALIMAGRIFADKKPMNATSFQRVALILAHELKNDEFVYSICNEIFATVYPLISNIYNTKWIVNPLLLIIDSLSNIDQTSQEKRNQEFLAKVSFALNSVFSRFYQEKSLSQFISDKVVNLPESEARTEFLTFSTSEKINKTDVGNSSLLLVAADLFKNSPGKSFEEFFNKHQKSPDFPEAAVYLISAAYKSGMFKEAGSWCVTALNFLKSELGELHKKEEPEVKVETNTKSAAKTKKPTTRKKNEPPPPTEEELAEIKAAAKLKETWKHYKERNDKNLQFSRINKVRSSLYLLQALCSMETDPKMLEITSFSNGFAKIAPPETKNAKPSKGRSKRKVEKAATFVTNENIQTMGSDNESTNSAEIEKHEPEDLIVQMFRRSIVLGNRSGESITIKSAVQNCDLYLSTIYKDLFDNKSLQSITGSSYLAMNSLVLIHYSDLNDVSSIKLLRDYLLLLISQDQIEEAKLILSESCKLSANSGNLIWTIENSLNEDTDSVLLNAKKEIKDKYDATENIYILFNSLLKKISRSTLFKEETEMYFDNDKINNNLVKSIYDACVTLQRKQKMSMSISLMSKVCFLLYKNGNRSLAKTKLCETLECHFRVVKAFEKVSSLLKNETEESFYAKHSWSGCLSIFVISSMISLIIEEENINLNNQQREISMNLIRLASFALSSLFANTVLNPNKEIDFVNFEPSEIVPGIDIYSHFDPKQPLLEPPPIDIIVLSITHLISAMLSYELYFEMFKPLSFARHLFRFIVREKRGLARFRLITVIAASQFGFIPQSINIINDVITSYGESTITIESSNYSEESDNQRIQFDALQPMNSEDNINCYQMIVDSQIIDSISSIYGFPLSCIYAVAVSQLLQSIAKTADPSLVLNGEPKSKKEKGTKGQKHSKKQAKTIQSHKRDLFAICIKLAKHIVSTQSKKEFTAEQMILKYELQLEQAKVCMNLWKWNEAQLLTQEIITSHFDDRSISYLNKAALNSKGIAFHSKKICAYSCYYSNELSIAEKYSCECSPYLHSLILINKSDLEGAATLLSKIALIKPITAFYKEHVLSVAQLVYLFVTNKKLYNTIVEKVGHAERQLIDPIKLIASLNETVFSFYTDELNLNEYGANFLTGNHLLVRLKWLEAVVHDQLNGELNPIDLLTYSSNLLAEKTSYPSHGLTYLLEATIARIQMQNLLQKMPNIIQYWNQNEDRLLLDGKIPIETVDKIATLLYHMFVKAPDCVVHPLSQQSILDLALLSGLVSQSSFPQDENEPDKDHRIELSLNTLSASYVVRSSKRTVQSLIQSSPESIPPPSSCSLLIFNDNKEGTLRDIAASYYGHLCTLDMPIFDTEISELRTLLFFKCFEEQCQSFKVFESSDSIQSSLLPSSLPVLNLDIGQIIGQWYQIDSSLFKTLNLNNQTARSARKFNEAATSITGKSSSRHNFTITSTTSSTSTSFNRNEGSKVIIPKGMLCFFIAIVVDLADKDKKKAQEKPTKSKGSKDKQDNLIDLMNQKYPSNSDQIKLIPLFLAAQQSDLRDCSNSLAEIGNQIDEISRLKSPDFSDAPHKDDAADAKGTRSRPKSRQKPKEDTQLKTDQNSAVKLLKNQADIITNNATVKWNITMHKTENVFSKSNKIVSSLSEEKSRWPSHLDMSSIDISNSSALSHFFNTQYGINEKSQQFAEWIINSITDQMQTSKV